jgi:catechol 2,3-dioxygenase-like lactoylglutathione lyase family enzyme
MSQQLQNARLSHFALRVADVDRMAAFYADLWGLSLADEDGDHLFFRSATPEHHALALYSGPSRGFHHVAFEVPRRAELRRIADAAAEAGAVVLYGPGPSPDEPGIRELVRFLDPDGNVVEVCHGVDKVRDSYRGPFVTPRGLNHVVLTVRDLKVSEAFYLRVLGFRVSDWIKEFMTFMRCNANHHSLALKVGDPGMDHAAFTTRGWDEISKGVFHLGEHGVPRLRGPGRHGPGNNLFAYFADPEGNVVEYTAQVVQVNEATWQPKEWSQPSDQWPIITPTPKSTA